MNRPAITRRAFLGGAIAGLIVHHRPDHHGGKPTPTPTTSTTTSSAGYGLSPYGTSPYGE